METSLYYLVKFETKNAREDFDRLLASVAKATLLQLDHDVDTVTITHKETKRHAELKLISTQNSPFPTDTGLTITLSMENADGELLSFFRYVAFEHNFRIFSVEDSTFLPLDNQLMARFQMDISEKGLEVYRKKGFEFLYAKNPNLYYARKISDGTIHIINPALFNYFAEFSIDESDSSEFSYEVAANLAEFTIFSDVYMVPSNFYEYFGRQIKIFNTTGFDLRHINRKVFIKPMFSVLNLPKQRYELLTSEKSALNFADKVRPNEDFYEALIRITKDEVKIADDFVRARVYSIDFDRDKDNVLTPRLWVNILIINPKLTPEVTQKSDRGWVSLDKGNL